MTRSTFTDYLDAAERRLWATINTLEPLEALVVDRLLREAAEARGWKAAA